MNYLPNETHIRRSLQGYMGPWAGEIQQLLSAYGKLHEDFRKLKIARDDVLDCNGDMKAVHVPHSKFAALRDAVPL
jgi:hypothetical protein